MNVSSVNTSAWWYQQMLLKKADSSSGASTDSASTTSTARNAQNVFTNSDGDTFELSGTMPPPSGPPTGPPPTANAGLQQFRRFQHERQR